MGRFGNVMLVAGEPDLSLEVKRGEVLRFYFTNTANTRVFNATLPGAQMKLVGADAGHYEREELVDEVLLAPSERIVVDVLFPDRGQFELEHRTPDRSYRLASVLVADDSPEHYDENEFERRTNRDMAELRERIEPFLKAPPDKTLLFVAEMDMGVPEGVAVVYTCPMHPEVVSDEPGSCPRCGMKLLAQAAEETAYVSPMHPDVTSEKPDRCPNAARSSCRRTWSRLANGPATSPTTPTAITGTTTRTMTPADTGRAGTLAMPRTQGLTTTTTSRSTFTTRRGGSSGKTTWSRSTG